MQEENKLDTANLFFTDNYSIFDSSSEFFQQYKNDYDNKETQKNNFPSIFNEKNISTNNQEQDIKRSESITEINKCHDEKKNNIIPKDIPLKVYKQKTENNYYRKDAHYKHFKAFLGKYIKNKINELKNKCFPYYSKNNFPSIFNEKNISINNQEQDIKRRESITEINKCDDEKKNNIIPKDIPLKVYKQKNSI